MTAVGMAAVGLGLVLIWSGIKGEDIRTVFARTFTAGKSTPPNSVPRTPSASTPGLRTA